MLLSIYIYGLLFLTTSWIVCLVLTRLYILANSSTCLHLRVSVSVRIEFVSIIQIYLLSNHIIIHSKVHLSASIIYVRNLRINLASYSTTDKLATYMVLQGCAMILLILYLTFLVGVIIFCIFYIIFQFLNL